MGLVQPVKVSKGDFMKNYQIDSFVYNETGRENAVYIQGWYYNKDHTKPEWTVLANDQEVDADQIECRMFARPDLQHLFPEKKTPLYSGFSMKVCLPCKNPRFILKADGQELVNFSPRVMREISCRDNIQFDLQIHFKNPEFYQIVGWAISYPDEMVSLHVEDDHGRKVKQEMVRHQVTPSNVIMDQSKPYGFGLNVFADLKKSNYWLVMKAGHAQRRVLIRPNMSKMRKALEGWRLMADERTALSHIKGLPHLMRLALYRRGFKYRELASESAWLEENKLTEKELEAQRHAKFEKMPLISILVPAYKPPMEFFDKMIDSVLNQTYANWQLVIADGSPDDALQEHMKKYADEKRIVYVSRKDAEDRGISANTNEAAAHADGEYFGFMDHDDLLSQDALYEVVKAINEEDPDLIYSDEDKVCWIENKARLDGGYEVFDDLTFKPDFSIDYLRCNNYINHFSVTKRSIFEQMGGLRPEFDGSQDYDFWLRAIELTDWSKIKHIPKILYHWRKHAGSTAGEAGQKNWAVIAGERALKDYFGRNNIDVEITDTPFMGRHKIHYLLKEEPLISIIIPNKDHIRDLKRLLEGLENRNNYKNYEILIVENNSTEKATFEFYKYAERNYRNVKVLYWDGIFNYSAINNFAARQAKGELLLLLNNDTDVMDENFLSLMAGNALRPEVGAVGIKLLYEDDTIQHGGVILGANGPYHAYVNEEPDTPHFDVIKCVQHNVSAVTAACLMVSAKKYWEVGGLDEIYEVAYNDIDFCLKLLNAGYYNVMLAEVKMHHLESISRGADTAPEKARRFRREQHRIVSSYRDYFEKGDPYYNPNLSLLNPTGSLRSRMEKGQIQSIWEETIDDSDIQSWK